MSISELAVRFFEQQQGLSLAIGALFGTLFGSFLNVVIVRLPQLLEDTEDNTESTAGTSVAAQFSKWLLISPPSHCPGCSHRLAWYENVPLLSYLALAGKCSACRTAISLRYPMVEALTGALALLALWRFGFTAGAATGFGLACLLLVIAFIDAELMTIPDMLTLPAIWVGLAASAIGGPVTADRAILGAVCGYGILALINAVYLILTHRQGIGRGDWKLAAVIGAWLGLQGLIGSLIVAFLTGSLVGLAMMLFFSRDRRSAVPFGPFLACGGIIAIFFGQGLANWYLGLIIGP